jgi:hypothetical protein
LHHQKQEDTIPINDLYHTWNERIQQLQPTERNTHIRNFTWLIVGIHQSRSVCLSRIAGKMPGEAKLLSTIQRLNRLLANPAINVRNWYEPIAREWLVTANLERWTCCSSWKDGIGITLAVSSSRG